MASTGSQDIRNGWIWLKWVELLLMLIVDSIYATEVKLCLDESSMGTMSHVFVVG